MTPARITRSQTCSSTHFPRSSLLFFSSGLLRFFCFCCLFVVVFFSKSSHLHSSWISSASCGQISLTKPASRPNDVFHTGLFLGLLSKSASAVMDDVTRHLPRAQEGNGWVGALRCFETASALRGRRTRRWRRWRKVMALCVILMTLLATVHLV